MGWTALPAEDGVVTDTALMRLAPKRGREQWLERLRRSGAVRPRWELRPPEVTARRVRVLRAVAGRAASAQGRAGAAGAAVGGGRRRADAARAGGRARGRCRARCWRRPGGWWRSAPRSWTGATSSATRWRTGNHRLRQPMTWRRSSGPRWRPSRRCRRAASCCWRAWRRRARRMSTWRPSTRRCSAARRRSCWCRRCR